MRSCDCCCSKEQPRSRVACPDCHRPGPTVPDETLDALLTPRARKLRASGPYHFCDTADCPTVYYSADGQSRFGKGDLTVRVGSKETDAPRPLCYCLGHTYESIRDEWARTGESASLRAIENAIKEGTCHCRTTNPRGACCLPEVRRFVAGIQEGNA